VENKINQFTRSLPASGIKDFRQKLLKYLQGIPVFCILDSNGYYAGKDLSAHPYYHSFDFAVAIGVSKTLSAKTGHGFHSFEAFQKENPHQWMFGYFGYDLKNELEKLSSENPDSLNFPDLYFFIPETVILIKNDTIIVETSVERPADIIDDIENQVIAGIGSRPINTNFKSRIGKEKYLETVNRLREHIIEGDVYEVSFCQEFYSENIDIDPFDVFMNLEETSPQPFGSFMRIEDKYILCASMERYLKKMGGKIISQPIKGTIRRGLDNEEDIYLKQKLLFDEKERAENVMIVDLVRNDLSRTCLAGTVKVEELFGIYDFPGVFQMISTVSGQLKSEYSGPDAIKTSFPMGSMTGAPKIKAMELIENYEKSKRGVYSGALGYFTPDGNFDFNVVIRTLLYNATKKYLSLHVGSAITYDSDPGKEYEECLVKIERLIQVVKAATA
jgi:para-aminobenzoate synthetase component I